MIQARKIICIFSITAIAIILLGTDTLQCYFQDTVEVSDITFMAFSSTVGVHTTQGDFEQGDLTFVDTKTVPGDVLLAKTGKRYRATGNIRSPVLNTGSTNTTIDLLYWDADLPPSTTITFYYRASDIPFSATSYTPTWINVGTDPPVSALPQGQYVQWRAYLQTSNYSVTPVLHEVQIWYH